MSTMEKEKGFFIEVPWGVRYLGTPALPKSVGRERKKSGRENYLVRTKGHNQATRRILAPTAASLDSILS